MEDFRTFLQNELINRTRANHKYSLRAFARRLEVQPGFLSKILLGQRNVTEKTVKRFGTKLGIPPEQLKSFLSDVESLPRNDDQYSVLMADQYHLISEWYHFAILQLTQTQHFNPAPKWISRALGISMVEVNAAIDRLKRLGFLEIKKDRSWRVKQDGLTTTTLGADFQKAALRQLQRQILNLAVIALDEIPIERRDQSAVTMAVDSSLLPEAKVKIKKFRRALSRFLESGKQKDHVFNLSVSLYPVTKFPGGKNE